jgi:hypothetical protein
MTFRPNLARQFTTQAVPLAALAALFATTALGAERFRHLTAREIRARLSGMEFTDEAHWAQVFARGGELKSFALGRARTGTWRVENDQLCLDREVDGQRCFQVWVSGRNVQLRDPVIEMVEEGILQRPQTRP